jgi:hypothetical protein
MYRMSGADPMGDNGKAGADGNDHVGCEHVRRQLKGPILKGLHCTGREHIRRQHVPGANMSGANLRAPT